MGDRVTRHVASHQMSVVDADGSGDLLVVFGGVAGVVLEVVRFLVDARHYALLLVQRVGLYCYFRRCGQQDFLHYITIYMLWAV